MIDFNKVEGAADRVEQAKRLIQEAHRARMQATPLVASVQDQIDATRRASEASAGLARMIDAMNDLDDASPRA